tara:strand:+ start:405 stop:596 length:192 start_codon:yes stop_codon:yes gene_type:complete
MTGVWQVGQFTWCTLSDFIVTLGLCPREVLLVKDLNLLPEKPQLQFIVNDVVCLFDPLFSIHL